MHRGPKSLDLGRLGGENYPRTGEVGDTTGRLQIAFGEFQGRKGSLSVVHLSADFVVGSETGGLTHGSQMGRDALE